MHAAWTQAMGLAQSRSDPDGLAYRIPKQIDVCRVVRRASRRQRRHSELRGLLRGPFFYQYMTRVHHLLIDSAKQLWRKQARVVLECLHLVPGLAGPVAVTRHLAQFAVFIGQLVDPVEVRIQAKP